MPKPPSIPMRETCCVCGKISPIGFHVPDEVWTEVVHPSNICGVHCLGCFIARADDKLIDWDQDIKFFPVSMRTHIEGCYEISLPREVPGCES